VADRLDAVPASWHRHGDRTATWPTRAPARTATVHWLEAIYNRRRRHSAIDMLSPVDYEERYWDRRAAA
jgi:transposase InsO family protein